MRAKASWGYDAAFMDYVKPDMIVTPERIREAHAVVAEEQGATVGYAILKIHEDRSILHDLFVDPEHVGRGIGRQLFDEAVSFARDNGARELTLVSDPHTEAFYQHLGMRRIGTEPSIVSADRMLPVMSLDLQ